MASDPKRSKEGDVPNGEDKDGDEDWKLQLALEMSVKDICKMEINKEETISKLLKARQEELDQDRMSRRNAWKKDVERKLKSDADVTDVLHQLPLEEVDMYEKQKMMKMSMRWREELKSERNELLLPQVLTTLMRSTKVAHPDICTFRLISKTTKKSVDSATVFISDDNEQVCTTRRIKSDPEFMVRKNDHCPWMELSKFDSLGTVHAFAQAFQSSVNPFFTRAIYILPPLGSNSTYEFFKEIEYVLVRWGKELTSAYLCFPKNMSFELMYEMLVTWLKLMPNLHILVIKVIGVICSSAFDQLSKQIDKNPLPELVLLTHIYTSWSTPKVLNHAILSKYNAGLTRVMLGSGMDGSTGPTQVYSTVSNCALPAKSEGDFPAIREMTLLYYNISGVEQVGNIFNNLNNWCLPLKRLDLRFQNLSYDTIDIDHALTSKGLFLEMPLLEELRLDIHCSITLKTLDFLLPCKGLKVLVLSFLTTTKAGTSTTTAALTQHHHLQQRNVAGIFQLETDRLDNKDHAYQSRIWKLLPELNRIEVNRQSGDNIARAGLKPIWRSANRESFRFTREEYLQCIKK